MSFIETLSNISIVTYVFLGLFAIASIIQLILAFMMRNDIRRYEKPFCLLFLGLAVAFAFPTHPLIYIGAFCGLIGDIFLVIPRKKMLPIGTVFFFIGHVCYILEVFGFLLGGAISIWVMLGYFAGFALIIVLSYLFIFQKIAHSNIEALGMGLYFATLIAVLPTMIIATVHHPIYMFLGIIGSLFFIGSDVMIVYCKYVRPIRRQDFYIMSTYLLAQFLIVISFILTYSSI